MISMLLHCYFMQLCCLLGELKISECAILEKEIFKFSFSLSSLVVFIKKKKIVENLYRKNNLVLYRHSYTT